MKLDKAIEILEKASGGILPNEFGNPIVYPSIDKDDDAFLVLDWTDEDGKDYQVICLSTDNQEVRVERIEEDALVFKSNDGNEISVVPLVSMTIKED
jgi:hypothetical protein